MLAESPGGVHVVELAQLRDAELVAVAIAEALGLHPGEDLPSRVRDMLLGQPALLVLDNCEHLGGAAGAAAERLLLACPSLRVLATSREPVRSQGEALYDVEPLPPGAALQLLADRVRAVRPGLDLDAERDAAETICARLDGLPLALELAAARVRALGLTEVAARLDDRFGLLSSGTATAEERQRTLRGVVDWSYRLLTPAERSMFRRASVFAGTFDVEGAKEVAGEDAVEALAGLVDRSIVIAEPGSPARYRMLETLRSFGLEELAGAGEAGDAFARHEQWLVRRARTMARSLWTTGAERAARPFQAADRDLALALARALERGDADTALPLAAGAGQLAHVFGAVSLALPVLDAALALEGGDDADRIEALRVRGALLILQGDYSHARTCLGSAHALSDRFGDEALARRVRVHLARASYLDGNPVAARALLDGLPEALADAGERFAEGLALTVAGTIEFSYGDLETSVALLARALAAFEACGDEYGITDVCYFLGFAQADAGEAAAAAATYERGLAAAGDALPVYAVWLHYALGKLELAQGDAAAGEARADACAAAARLGGASVSAWYPLALRAEAALLRRRFDEAAAWSERARAHLEQARRHAGTTGHLDAMLAQTLQLAARAAAGRGRRREPRILQLAAARHALATKRPYAAAEGLEGVASRARERGPPRRRRDRCSARRPRSARPPAGRCCRRGGRRSTPSRRCSVPSTRTRGRSAARSRRARPWRSLRPTSRSRPRAPSAAPARGEVGLERGAVGEVRADLALDALQRVVDRLRVAARAVRDRLVRLALDEPRQDLRLELREARAEHADQGRQLLAGDDPRCRGRRPGSRRARRRACTRRSRGPARPACG